MGCSLLAEQSRGLTPQLSARSNEYRCDSALKFLKERHSFHCVVSPLGGSKLRIPIFSYFLVVGSVLTGLLLWFGNGNEPIEKAFTSSQTVGVPKFKPRPEAEHARATAVNHSERKSLQAAKMPPR
jgi:hypothetical protein